MFKKKIINIKDKKYNLKTIGDFENFIKIQQKENEQHLKLKKHLNNTMKACYVSDIHLEFLKEFPIINNNADILILAGDIGNPYEDIYKDFIIDVSNKFKKIFLITGNHEYYGHKESIENVDNYIDTFIKKENMNNVIFLNNNHCDYNGFRFIGSTLWSKILNLNSPKYDLTNCFNCIKDFKINKKEGINKYNNLFQNNYEYLNNTINKTTEESDLPIIVITHHLPSYKLIAPKYQGYDMNQCFASNCEELMKNQVKYWFYGHTHTEGDTIINNTRLLCNPLGYPDENTDVNMNKIIILENT